MRDFKHVDAKSVDATVTLLKESEGTARVMAGGTDLLGALKNQISSHPPETIINVKTIRALDFIKKDAKGLKIGALTRLASIADSPVVKGEWSILAEAAHSIGSPQIRNMATIGGNLCQDVRCWFYRASPFIGERYECLRKGGERCYAYTMENQYHSAFGAAKSGAPACASACPGSVDIPAYLDMIRQGDVAGAAARLMESNPLPAITGRVCPHFCEQRCVRNAFDEPVSVRAMERFIGDYILDHADQFFRPAKERTGKKVAVIGSGPAGLSAAYYCMTLGHQVTVFDKLEYAGGMLHYGIPEYILPKEVVQRTVKALANAGVEFQLGVDVGRDISAQELQAHYDSLFLSTGAWKERTVGIDGEASTESALSFLIEVKQGRRRSVAKRVLVVGGGNVAIDAAITARRLGAEEVTMICLECSDEMPALPWEIQQAVDEGVKLMPSWGPARVLQSNGKAAGLELMRCTAVFDENRCFAPTFDQGERMTVEGDQVILAIGQARDLSLLRQGWPLEVAGDLIKVDKETQASSIAGVFAGGDAVTAQGTVIEALAAGRRAASAVDAYLKGAKRKAAKSDSTDSTGFLKWSSDALERTQATKQGALPLSARDLRQEDIAGLARENVDDEAKRCFNCGCLAVHPSDIATVLLALDADITVAGEKGSRTMPVEQFITSLGTTLAPDEMVTEIRVPNTKKGAGQAFLKFRLRNALDFAMVSVAAYIMQTNGVCEDARIVLGSVAPVPVRAREAEQAIIGRAVDDAAAEAAAQVAAIDPLPLAKNSYKMDLVRALAKRAILLSSTGGRR